MTIGLSNADELHQPHIHVTHTEVGIWKSRNINHVSRLGFDRRLVQGTALIMSAILLSGLAGCSRLYHQSSNLSTEELVSRVDRGATWLLWKVDATDEQEARVKSLLNGLTPELEELESRHKVLKMKFAASIAEDQINQDELVRLRTDGLDLTGQAFNRSSDAMVQASAVLTPKQRKKLMEAWKDRQ
jgi:Spy/CpxP family protein refolding chaperone